MKHKGKRKPGRTAYVKDGCRCPECVADNTRYMDAYRKRNKDRIRAVDRARLRRYRTAHAEYVRQRRKVHDARYDAKRRATG